MKSTQVSFVTYALFATGSVVRPAGQFWFFFALFVPFCLNPSFAGAARAVHLAGSCFMGLISWLSQLLGWRPVRPATAPEDAKSARPRDFAESPQPNGRPQPTTDRANKSRARRIPVRRKLVTSRCKAAKAAARRRAMPYLEAKGSAPYKYARYGSQTGHYLDLSRDGDESRLRRFDLPVFHTPEQLADWISLPLNKVAWLVHRFSSGRPASVDEAHYHFHWVQKKLGGWRLIEAPKATLKFVQAKILRELLDNVPVHATAHGFAAGRSILTNARPHVGQAILLKLDLANFYTTVSFARVVAIFRSLGYSREVAIWLGLLTTSAVPGNLGFQDQGPYAILAYLRRHLPQGAPTSPALANLSAFGLDVRLSGMAKSFGATYTRYADDLTFSGPQELSHGLRTLIPLVQHIIRQERFHVNAAKRRVLRAHQRQTVTGVIVNETVNVARADFDRLKATLTNCLRYGPSNQNRGQVEDFFSHLQGRIAHVSMLNQLRGQRLHELFLKIDWSK